MLHGRLLHKPYHSHPDFQPILTSNMCFMWNDFKVSLTESFKINMTLNYKQNIQVKNCVSLHSFDFSMCPNTEIYIKTNFNVKCIN